MDLDLGIWFRRFAKCFGRADGAVIATAVVYDLNTHMSNIRLFSSSSSDGRQPEQLLL